MKRFLIISLFPEMFKEILNSSMMWKAQKEGAVSFDVLDLRQFGQGVRRQVDDKPFGGGAGMLLMVEPLTMAIEEAKRRLPGAKVVIMTPTQDIWNQDRARDFANNDDDYIIVCGRYEGFDARVFDLVDYKVSIGHYILTGGELPAMVMIDSIVRLLSGVLGGGDIAYLNESYSEDVELEYPQYTRPEDFRGQKVPAILLSGDHAKIEQWRLDNSVKKNN